MNERTLCIVVRGDAILLGLKKRGFGAGKRAGFGGKIEAGERVETAEMQPMWFAHNELPLAEMWQDAPLWLPLVLAGEQVTMTITFAEDNETVSSFTKSGG